MNYPNKHDRLDQYINKQFQKSIDQKESWTDPSEDIFLAAMQEVDALDKSKSKKWWIPAFLMSMFLVLIISMVGFQAFNTSQDQVGEIDANANSNKNSLSLLSNIENSESKISNKEPINNLVPNKKTKELHGIGDSKTEPIITQISNTKGESSIALKMNTQKSKDLSNDYSSALKNVQLSSIESPSFNLNKTSISFTQSEVVSTSMSKDILPSSLEKDISNPAISETKNAQTIGDAKKPNGSVGSILEDPQVEELKELPIISDLSSLNKKTNLLDSERVLSQNFTFVQPHTPQSDKNFNHQFNFLVGTKFTSIRMSNLSSTQNIEGYKKLRLGYFGGLGFKSKLTNKLSIESSILISSFKIKSWYEDEMIFDETHLFQDSNGNEMYDASMNLESPMGMTVYDDPMHTEPINFENREVLDMDVRFKHEFKTLEFNLGVSYDIFKVNRFTTSINVGSNFMRLLDYEEWFNVDITNQGSLVMGAEHTHSPMDQTQRWVVGGTVGLGFNLDLTDRLFVGLNSSYFYSINPINNLNQANSSKSHLNCFNLSITTGFRF